MPDSRISMFKKRLRKQMEKRLGIKLTDAKAYAVFKDSLSCLVKDVAKNPDIDGEHRLSIKGVGGFYIKKRKMSTVMGEEHPLKGKIPHTLTFNWSVSEKIEDYLYKTILKFDRRKKDVRR